MATDIYIGLDLGNDTMKVSFAYNHEGCDYSGKLMVSDLINQIAFPAAAFYNTETDTWLYADELEYGSTHNFSTVIKIKTALSMVTRNPDGEVETRNLNYYRNGHYFPVFTFPERMRHEADFQYFVNRKLVFTDPRHTPQSVCEGYFLHIRKRIGELVDKLSERTGIEFAPLRHVAIVHPPKQGTEFVAEVSRLVEVAFGVAPTKVLTSTQALGIYAYHRGWVEKDERVLVFDMGDETVSVCKAWFSAIGAKRGLGKMGLLVDSADGHMPLLEVGGSHIDEVLLDYLERGIYDRETVGTPSAGASGHIYEEGLHEDRYLLMKDIKKAKMVMPLAGRGIFKDGVPVCIHRDTLVQRIISESAFAHCVGTDDDRGVAHRLRQYLLEELARPGNRDIRKAVIAGGLVETRGLVPYLQEALAQDFGHVQLLTFDTDTRDLDPYHIQNHEASTYAASVGGAVVAMKDYAVDAVLSYSYGTWLYHGNYRKHLKLFADRGDILEDEENRFSMEGAISLTHEELHKLEGDELFSTIISSDEITAHRYANKLTYEDDWLIVGDVGDDDRRRAEEAIDLRVVAGGRESEIHFYYKNQRVSLFSAKTCAVYFEEGFLVSKKDGSATPFFSNVTVKNRFPIYAKYHSNDQIERVSASDIEFRISMKTMSVTTNQ